MCLWKTIKDDARGDSPHDENFRVADTIPVAPAWAGHTVGFALLTLPPKQFVAFYDENRQLTVASRLLTEREWQFVKLSETRGLGQPQRSGNGCRFRRLFCIYPATCTGFHSCIFARPFPVTSRPLPVKPQ